MIRAVPDPAADWSGGYTSIYAAQADTRLHIIIETNAGLEAVYDIAKASPRMEALFFGGVDMAAELRCKNAWEPLLYARSRVVHAAAGAGLDVIDVPYLDLEDPEGMEREATLARDLGFSGKGSIHPKQIAILNKVFTPDEAQIERARRIIAAFEEADTGLVVVDGKLIEKPVLRDMHRILAIDGKGCRIERLDPRLRGDDEQEARPQHQYCRHSREGGNPGGRDRCARLYQPASAVS